MSEHRVVWQACAWPGCRSVNTMGTHCIRHWYASQGKPCPEVLERPAKARHTRPALTRATTVPGATQESHEAARRALGRSGSQRRRIYELVLEHADGLTADDVQRLTGLPTNSVNPRVNELAGDGWLADSGQRRPTRYGVPATVWVAVRD